jgi:F0F1-type ATP synthase assembly protein I
MATTEEITPARTGTHAVQESPEQVPWRNIALGFIGVVLIGIGLGLVVNSVADAVWLTIRLLVIVAVVAMFGLVLSEVRRRKRRKARLGASRQAAERGARADKTRRDLTADASRIPVVAQQTPPVVERIEPLVDPDLVASDTARSHQHVDADVAVAGPSDVAGSPDVAAVAGPPVAPASGIVVPPPPASVAPPPPPPASSPAAPALVPVASASGAVPPPPPPPSSTAVPPSWAAAASALDEAPLPVSAAGVAASTQLDETQLDEPQLDEPHLVRPEVLDAIAPHVPVEPEPAVAAMASLFAPPSGPPLPPPPGVVSGLPVLPVAPDAVMPPPPPPPPLPQRVTAPLASPAIPTSAMALDRTRSVVGSVAPVIVFRYRKWVLGQMTPGAVFEPLAIEGGLDDWALLSACGVATLLAWTHEDHNVTHPVEAWVDELLPAHGVRIRDRQLAIDLVLAAALRAGGVEAPQSPHVRSYEPADLVTALASIHVGLLRMYCGLGRIGAERVLADQYGITAGDPSR